MKENLFSKQDLRRLIFPLVAEQFLAMTIGACDTVMVSSVGEAGVSGVSLIDQLTQLFIQLFAAFATGGAVVSSQYLGHKSDEKARTAARQLLNISTFVALVIIAICLPLRHFILNLIYGKIDESVMQNALIYFVWILLSFPFLAIYNSCAALFRSMGNSKISLKVSLMMNLTNIAGNAVLIYGAKIGVAGAGIATLASRIVAAIVMVYLLARPSAKINSRIYLEKLWKIEIRFDMIRKILKVAIPSGIENSVFHIGKILVYSFMSGFGLAAIAANAITNTIASFSNIPAQAIGLSSVTVIGQCIGAGEKEQAKSYGHKLMKEAYIGMFCVATAIFLLCPLLVRAFNLSDEARLLATGVIRTCMVANIFFWPMSFTMPNILRASGDAKFTMVVSNISMWLFRVLFSFLISKYLLFKFPENTALALYGIWFGMYIDWVFRGLCFGIRFHRNRWLDKKVI
ncbi:MAG: MATE family efflux transporter [Treponema sp.]|uniref:MATE family efflux transporter n=1 Tax=Treponema sp. TaxID=166 RepID=UPI0025D843CD|nr:MATE family efflux transporter [Treponema sp.]MBQ8679376.1 MATE family efflux transporter [Treponema sp.]